MGVLATTVTGHEIEMQPATASSSEQCVRLRSPKGGAVAAVAAVAAAVVAAVADAATGFRASVELVLVLLSLHLLAFSSCHVLCKRPSSLRYHDHEHDHDLVPSAWPRSSIGFHGHDHGQGRVQYHIKNTENEVSCGRSRRCGKYKSGTKGGKNSSITYRRTTKSLLGCRVMPGNSSLVPE
jgi:hypothetical protein